MMLGDRIQPMETWSPNDTGAARENQGLEKEATGDLKDLGLDWDSLRGKVTLDIGAGPAVIADVAKNKGIKIFSLDKNPDMWAEQEGIKIPAVPYVRANAEKLPFEDGVFDLVISHAGPILCASAKEEVAKMFKEAVRVLRPGGEMRLGPGYMNANAFNHEELFTHEEEESFTTEQRVERIKNKSAKFLQGLDSNIKLGLIENPTRDYPSQTFFSFVKPKSE